MTAGSVLCVFRLIFGDLFLVYFVLEDILSQTILGTPIEELQELADKSKKSLQAGIIDKKNIKRKENKL